MSLDNDIKGLRPQRTGILVRVFAWLRGGRVVWLKDREGEVYCSIAQRDAFGQMQAPVYWFSRVGSVVLLPGGDVDKRCASNYIVAWTWADRDTL